MKKFYFTGLFLLVALALCGCGISDSIGDLVKYSPTTPSMPVPANEQVDVDTLVLLNWYSTDNNTSDTLRYSLFFDTTVAGLHKIDSNLTAQFYQLNGLLPGQKYYWKVSVTDGDSVADGPLWSFTVKEQVVIPGWKAFPAYETFKVISMAIGANSVLWAGTQYHGLLEYDIGNNRSQLFDSTAKADTVKAHTIPFLTIPSLAINPANGSLWIGTAGKGLWYTTDNGTNFISENVSSTANSGIVKSIAFDNGGNMWAGFNANGIYRKSSGLWKPIGYYQLNSTSSLISQKVNCIATGNNSNEFSGGIWAITDTGLGQFAGEIDTSFIIDSTKTRRKTWKINHFSYTTISKDTVIIINSVNIDTVIIDTVKIDTIKVDTLKIDSVKVSKTYINTPLFAFDSLVLIDTTYKDTLVHIEYRKKRTIYLDSVWTRYSKPGSALPSNILYRAVYSNSQQALWIGSQFNGLIKFSQGQFTTFSMSNSNIPTNNITALALDSVGNIWIGTNIGLIKFNGTSTWTRYAKGSSTSLPSDVINCIAIDNTGKVWVGTNNGIARLDPAIVQ